MNSNIHAHRKMVKAHPGMWMDSASLEESLNEWLTHSLINGLFPKLPHLLSLFGLRVNPSNCWIILCGLWLSRPPPCQKCSKVFLIFPVSIFPKSELARAVYCRPPLFQSSRGAALNQGSAAAAGCVRPICDILITYDVAWYSYHVALLSCW